MSRQAGKVLHKSIDITRSTHNLTPIRKTSPSRAIVRSKGHTNSFTSSSSQSSLSKPAKARHSPYSQPPTIPIRMRNDAPRMRASSPLIKKINSEHALAQKPPYGGHRHHSGEVQTAAVTDVSLLRAKTLNTSSSIPANLSLVPESPPASEVLESKLSGKLRDCVGTQQEFQACSDVFQEAIQADKAFGAILSKIKTAYEEAFAVPIDTEKLTEDVKNLGKSLQMEKEERRFALKKLEKLSLENLELSRSLDDREGECIELQEKLYHISQVDMKEVPREEQSWQFLVSENRSYQDLFGRMERDLANFKKREKKLLKLLLAMKRRGYPVDEIYEEEFQHPKSKKQIQLEISETLDESESEPIIEGPPKPLARPEAVPPLRLSEVEPDSESDSEHEVSSDASSMHLTGSKKKPQEGQPNPHSLGTKSSVDSSKVRTVAGGDRHLLV